MKLEFRNAELNDAPLLIDIYNDAFYQDYLRYGECPGYGKTLEMMERSNSPSSIIMTGKRLH